MIASDGIELWFWELKDEITGKWRRTSWGMTEADARARHGNVARKIEGTLEVRGSAASGLSHLQPDHREE